MNQYTKRAELHCHSLGPRVSYFPWFYDAPQTVEEVVAKCLELRVEILSITDHDTLLGSKRALEYVIKNKLPILIVPGEEVTTREGHILAYGIKEAIPRGLSAQETIDRIHEQGGVAVAAHPFNVVMSLRKRIYKLRNLDAMEVMSPLLPKRLNRLQKLAQKRLGIPGIAGSDAHENLGIGIGKTWFKDEVRTEKDFITALRKGDFAIEESFSSGAGMLRRQMRANLKLKRKTVMFNFRRKLTTPVKVTV